MNTGNGPREGAMHTGGVKAESDTPRPATTPDPQVVIRRVDADSYIPSGRWAPDISRRDFFAVTLMAGILSNQKLLENLDEDVVTPVQWAVYQADSLIQELDG